MHPNRRYVRQLESGQESTPDALRASTADSGRGSMATTDRSSTLDRNTATSTSSSLFRDTPLDGYELNDGNERDTSEDDTPLCIPRITVFANKCYEQAFVSHIDHPSAFFLQLAHPEKEYEKLQQNINEFYLKNPMNNPSWKRGEYCIAKYDDKSFYRARIIEIPKVTNKKNLYDVVYVDFGNWCQVSVMNIHRLLPQFAILPAQALPCSLARTLPKNGTWFDYPQIVELFKKLVLEEYVDATFELKPSRDCWPLSFVTLEFSCSKTNVRDRLKESGCIRDVNHEEIYLQFEHLLKPVDYIIYNIPHEGDDHDDQQS